MSRNQKITTFGFILRRPSSAIAQVETAPVPGSQYELRVRCKFALCLTSRAACGKQVRVRVARFGPGPISVLPPPLTTSTTTPILWPLLVLLSSGSFRSCISACPNLALLPQPASTSSSPCPKLTRLPTPTWRMTCSKIALASLASFSMILYVTIPSILHHDLSLEHRD